jgi:hypothetical protein
MTTAHAGEVATRLVRTLPAFIAAFVGALAGHGPMPPLPRGHQGPAPFMRRRSQAKRRKLARRRTTR